MNLQELREELRTARWRLAVAIGELVLLLGLSAAIFVYLHRGEEGFAAFGMMLVVLLRMNKVDRGHRG